MSIKKRSDGQWAVLASVRVDGIKNPVQRRGIFPTKGEASVWEIDEKRRLKAAHGSLTLSSISTYKDAATLYVDSLKARDKLSDGYHRMINFSVSLFGSLSLDAVPAALLLHRRNNAGKLKGTTLNRHTAVVKAIFTRLAALDLIPKNPINSVKFPKYKETARDRVLTVDERARLMAAITNICPWLLPLVSYLLAVPCRISELKNAKKDQFSPITNTIYIPDTKNGDPNHKPIPPHLLDYFRSIPEGCPYLFYKEINGKFYPLSNLRRDWEKVLKAAGIADFHIHDTRHISATEMYLNGNSERAIRSAANWKTDMLTRYFHADSLRDAQNIVFKAADIGAEVCKVSS